MAELFDRTVHSVNAKDYTEEQLRAWAPGWIDVAAWDRSFLAHLTLVAEADGILVGFGDIDTASGYLDRLYVHSAYQGRGIASAICRELESAVSGDTVTVHASVTAKPFFLGRGYRLLREQQVCRNGVSLTNFVMVKDLRPLR